MNITTVPRWIRTSGWLLLGGLLLIGAGLYNGFPLVTSDSGTYLNSALLYTVPDDRPITYGLFVRFTSLRLTLWLVIFVQGVLLAGLLLRCVAEFVPRLQSNMSRFLVVGFTIWATGVSWYCSQLMPDIFTAIGLLSLCLLLLGRFRSPGGQLLLLLILALATLMHNSHLLINTLVVVGFGLVAYQQRLFARGLVRRAHWLATTGVVLSSWLLLPTIQAGFGGGFTLSRASPAFLMARLCETGILEQYLDRNCGTYNGFKLCAYRDKLPNDAIAFMWDENSPFNQTGGLKENLSEYQQIVRDVLTSPRYYPLLISESIQATLRQLTHIGYGDGLTPYRENTNPYWKVQVLVAYELKEYMSSLQNRNSLSFTTLNDRVYGLQWLSLLLLALFVRRATKPDASASTKHLLLLLVVVGLGMIANAFVTGALANVLDRLQSRVAWLVPFVAILVAVQEGPLLLQEARRAWLRVAPAEQPTA